MVRKKLDERIRTLLSICHQTNRRALLLLVGDHGKDQIPNLHQILCRVSEEKSVKSDSSSGTRSVLWCYKKELGFGTHKKKRMAKIQRDKKRGLLSSADGAATADNFELFLTNTPITWCYYKDTHRILGSTHLLLVLQDFEALTPNIMARTIETVRGGGVVVFLMRSVQSLKQLYAMTMDVHARYRTESSGDIVPRFNERFILSLAQCENCLVCDDELNILPLSKKTLARLTQIGTSSTLKNKSRDNNEEQQTHNDHLEYENNNDDNDDVENTQLKQLKKTLEDTPHVGKLVELTKTLDQARALLTFLEACADRDKKPDKASSSASLTANAVFHASKSTTVSLTAPRGRGKSAALGLCLAGAISFGFNSIVVTAPEPENLVSVFQFLIEGLKALKYQEHYDYTIGYNYGMDNNDKNKGEKAGRENIKCIVSLDVHGRGTKRQKVRYLRPVEVDKFEGAELVAVDEAAAIPLPLIRSIMRLSPIHGGVKGKINAMKGVECDDRRLTFLSSTINGYEGTGRALSLKLIKELRDSIDKGLSKVDAAREAGATIAGPSSNKGEAKVHEKRWAAEAAAAKGTTSNAMTNSLKELNLSHPIRYAQGDPVERWLNNLLCLDCDSFDYNNTFGKNNIDSLSLRGGAPAPMDCELYHVNRDALFSFHRLSESFLQKLWGLYTSAHYKNTPNDLQMLSDAPTHHIFVLLGPNAESDEKDNVLPDILAIVQTSLEGKISQKTIQAQLARGHRSAGDLIPWTISQQFGDGNFAQLSGARIVRVAVHPAVQGLGYGSRVMELLFRYYNGEMVNLSLAEGSPSDSENSDNEDTSHVEDTPSESDVEEIGATSSAFIHKETLKPRIKLPPLLLPLSAVPTPRLDWLGTSFGLTPNLHSFWQRKVGMTLLYLRQTTNELTGEHSAIMIRALPRRSGWDDAWLVAFGSDARRRIGRLLGSTFRGINVSFAVSLMGNATGGFGVHSKQYQDEDKEQENRSGGDQKKEMDKRAVQELKKRSGNQSTMLTSTELYYHLTPYDLQRLELYSRNLCDHHLISDIIPSISQLYFTGRMGSSFSLSSVQAALLCGLGLQLKSVDDVTVELGLPINQVLAMFNKAIKKISMAFNQLLINEESENFLGSEAILNAEKKMQSMKDIVGQTLEEDVEDGAIVAMEELKKGGDASSSNQLNSGVTGTRVVPEIMDPEIMKYAMKGTDEDWANALKEKKDIDEGTIQIRSTAVKKRKTDQNILESVLKNEKDISSNKQKKKKSKKKS